MSETDFEARLAAYLLGGWGRTQSCERASDPEWYALCAAPQRERQAAAGLAERGFTFFLPMEMEWRGKPRVQHMSPLLPGYVFALCGPEDFADLHGIEGIQGFVRYLREDGAMWPLAFPASDILGLQMEERAGAFDRTRRVKAPRYQPKKGERVKIKAGTYLGFFAKVLAAPSGERRKIMIEGFDPPRHKTLDVRHLEAA
jgi:transcription antitermination factor NusG